MKASTQKLTNARINGSSAWTTLRYECNRLAFTISSAISSSLSTQDLQECKKSMEKMAESGRRGIDDEETEELASLSLTPSSHILLGKVTRGKALSKCLCY